MSRKLFISVMLLSLLIMTALPLAAAPLKPEGPPPASNMTSLVEVGSSQPPETVLSPHAFNDPSPENAMRSVIIELEHLPLTAQLAQTDRVALTAIMQQMYVAQLASIQSQVEAQLNVLGVEVMDRYQLVYNGFLARVPADRIELIDALPAVKAVHDAPVVYPNLSYSVPLIKADEVINDLGYDGTGITVGIIDTGIDYMHEAFGGSGSVADYQANDPSIITDYPIATPKIAGGWDFAHNDPDPMDYDGHGTHVASIVAGMDVSGTLSSGVAPGATLYALKVFEDGGGGSGSTWIISALEWAMDPNQDGNLEDHLDVVNMSLGSTFGKAGPQDPEVVAINNASQAGVAVVTSAGNDGNTHFITDAPGVADSAISVAASSTGYTAEARLSYDGTSYPYTPGTMINSPRFTETLTAELFNVSTVQITPTLCTTDGFTAGALADKIALILFHLPAETGCTASQQANHAASLGAKAALFYHYTPNLRGSIGGDPAPIPIGMITLEDAQALVAAGAHGQNVTIHRQFELGYMTSAVRADTIGSFSSRGPRLPDGALKPEVTAPGVKIVAAAAGSGNGGVALNGTSMAAPHVAGVAALMRQAHPDWTPELVKAAMMNTAVDLADGSWVSRYGAGRVDARAAVEAETLVGAADDLVSFKWGYIPFLEAQMTFTDTFTFYNEGPDKTYDVDWHLSTTQTLRSGVDLHLPVSVTVGSGSAPSFEMAVTLDAQAIYKESQAQVMAQGKANILEAYHGFVTFTNQADTNEVLRLPFYVIPRPYTSIDVATTAGDVQLTHTGAISSALETYAAYVDDPDDALLPMDEVDIRWMGMRHYENNGILYLVPLVSTWGVNATLAQYLQHYPNVIIVLYLDVDEDGNDDYYLYALSAQQMNGSSSAGDKWLLMGVDASGQPLNSIAGGVRTDYFAGYMEWHVFAPVVGIDTTNNPDFDFRFAFMAGGTVIDTTAKAHYDLSQPDITYRYTAGELGPDSPTDTVTFDVQTLNAEGALIVDLNGLPGEEVRFIPLLNRIYLPLIMR